MSVRLYKIGFTGFVVLQIAALSASTGPCHAQTLDDFYNQIMALEGQLPIPEPYHALTVGTFDAASGVFDGLVSTTIRDPATQDPGVIDDPSRGGRPGEQGNRPPRVGGGKPGEMTTIIPSVYVDSVNAGLIFNVTNRNGRPDTVTVGEKSRTFTVDSITIEIGRAVTVDWSIECGGKSHTDALQVLRLPRVGAFTIPALPVTILYDAPQFGPERNTASYTNTRALGTTLRDFSSSERSSTRPGELDEYVVAGFVGTRGVEITVEGSRTAWTALAVAGIVSSSFLAFQNRMYDLILAAVGSVSIDNTQGTRVTEEHALQMNTSQSVEYATEGLGPGAGDRIVILKNARIVWMTDNQLNPSLHLLGYNSQAAYSVATLKLDLAELTPAPKPPTLPGVRGGRDADRKGPSIGSRTGLNRECIEDLLNVDPFATGGEFALLDDDRFAYGDVFEGSGGNDTFTFEHEVTDTDFMARERFRTYVRDQKAGFLSFIGIGPEETERVESTNTYGHSEEVSESEMVSVSFEIHSPGTEPYAVRARYDRIFGTFAFQKVETQAVPRVAGTAQDASGNAAAGRIITVLTDTGRYFTRSNTSGRFEFRALPQDLGAVRIGGGRQWIDLGLRTGPVRDIRVTVDELQAPIPPGKPPGRPR